MSRLAFAIATAALLSCSDDPCPGKTGQTLCGYCAEDALATGNPHAGKCRYCGEGSRCDGDICGDLQCLTAGGGGTGGGGCLTCFCPQYSSCGRCGGTFCKNNLCSPSGWCCPGACKGCGCG